MEYLRAIDEKGLASAGPDVRWTQMLHDRSQGATDVEVRLIRTPGGSGSPEGLHTHTFEQVFYVLEGTMHVEIDGVTSVVEAPGAVVFPEGVPHRNWNERPEPTLHLAINAPAPAVGAVISHPVRR